MIAHVTAASGHYEETYNTLVYASRAKNIVNKVDLDQFRMTMGLANRSLFNQLHLRIVQLSGFIAVFCAK